MKLSDQIKPISDLKTDLALLKILALGQRQIEEGKVQPADSVIERLSRRNTYK